MHYQHAGAATALGQQDFEIGTHLRFSLAGV
jgi:hypothetical protein